MNIVIAGAGKVGYYLAQQLANEKHDVTVIDSKKGFTDSVTNYLDAMVIEGSCTNLDVLKEANVHLADLYISATSSDEVNVLSCIMSKSIGAKNVMARIRDSEYSRHLGFFNEKFGLLFTLNPDHSTAREILRMLKFSNAINVEHFASGKLEIVEFRLGNDSPLDGVALHELYAKHKVKVLICAVLRDNNIYIPSGDFVLKAGDVVSVSAQHNDLFRFGNLFGISKVKPKRIVIVGGSRIGLYLARELAESENVSSIKIVEKDRAIVDELKEKLPGNVIIIHGDASESSVMEELDLERTDSFIALTGMDEENIIFSMYAKKCGVKKVIAKVNNTSFAEMFENSGIDAIVSTKKTTADSVLQYARALENTRGSNVDTLYKVAGGRAEALGFMADISSKCIGIKLKDLQLIDNLVIAGIIRKDKVITPGGSDMICARDRVIVITSKSKINALDDILK